MRLRFPLAFALVALLAAAAAPAGAQQVQRIAAIVNDDVVSIYDLQARMKMVVASSGLRLTPQLRRRLAPQILRALIDERLRLQEAKRRNISVTKRNMRRAIAGLERRNNVPSGQFDRFLAENGIPKRTVMDQIRARIAWTKLINRRIAPRITVGDDEVDEALARIKARQGQVEYRISEILLTVERPEQEAEIRRTAERLVEQIRLGARFDAIARQFSQSASASVGGDLGWIQDGALDRRLRAVVATLKEGEVSKPIATLAGIQIVRLTGKRRGLADAPDDTVVALRRIALPLPAKADRDEIDNQINLARTIGETVTGCADMSRVAKEVEARGRADLGRVRLGELAPAIRAAVRDLPVGKASRPVRTDNAVLVLMVCQREQPKTGLPSRKEIETRLRRQRLDMLARRYMRDLRNMAVVDFRV